jgi:acyl transferase domain-containing protein
MIAALRRTTRWNPGHTTVAMLGRAGDEERVLLAALATLWERGADRALDAVDQGPTVRCFLPSHPFAGRDPSGAPVAPPVRPRPAG